MIKYNIKQLSALDVFNCIKDSKEVYKSLYRDEESNELVNALSEYSALAFYCLYDGENKAFPSSLEVLKVLSITELCEVYDEYITLYQLNYNTVKQGTNESFNSQINDINL